MTESPKIGICGNYSNGDKALNGQTVKTKILTSSLSERFPVGKILRMDTSVIKKKPWTIFTGCKNLLENCDNIIILPAQTAIRVIVPIMIKMNKRYKKKLHYYVVGGWVFECLKKHPRLDKYLRRLDVIYVELHSMEEEFIRRGYLNVVYVNKFRKINKISANELNLSDATPHRLCYFSRVRKEKGIEDAIDAVAKANETFNEKIFELDIYGKIDDDYSERFREVSKNFPNGVRYCGVVDFNKSTPILKDYYAMVFPTYYSGEGYANTIVDAFSAGLPVIATDWKYNSEVIRDGEDGIIYSWKHPEQLCDVLIHIGKNPRIIPAMKLLALSRVEEYDPQKAILPLIEKLV